MENSVFSYFNSLDVHEHICHLYYEDSECYELATNFLLNGVQNNERCIFFSDRPMPEDLLIRLIGHGITSIGKGSEKVLEDFIINAPVKESKKAHAYIDKVQMNIDALLKKHSGPLRILMMQSDNFYFLTNSERLLKRAYLNKISQTTPIILMSQFHIDRLSSKDVLSIFKTHPTIVEKNNVYKSPLYTEPDAIIEGLEKESEKFDALSDKEKKVLGLIINGLSNSGIAKELSISIKTVETHRANIMKKLEIHNLVDLVKFSMRNGIA